MKKLTKREKVIIGVSVVVVAVVTVTLQKRISTVADHYNLLADKLCSGGVWKAGEITKNGFKLIPVECCGGNCCKK